ncbi:AraC family transcriptional regulator [Palleronia sp. LCG004]|uniref:AraC family transcriptional regulator n=1 Tax=Palleronia sp. LCG004 TaxID=3079304 RepID=UPI002942AA13|nr:AraC family transcriptional regulator [Palleronia sp. LCG004]WOI58299.1 AraC family transcriptional regulator [Palleronia sp. LCG004]
MSIAQSTSPLARLLVHCRRFADANAGPDGLAQTPVRGLSVVRILQPGDLMVAVQKPVIAMLLQGRKRVTTLGASFEYAPGEAMVVAADIPTVSRVTRASIAAPYYALVLELDPAILSALIPAVPVRQGETRPVRIEPIDPEVIDAALRLARLLDRPEALSVLGDGLLQELHYWLLTGVHGPAIAALGAHDSHAGRIARAVDLLRRDYARPVRVEELAGAAGMSEPAFHKHFRAITTLSPLQFQKQLRLIEARRLMLTEGAKIAQAAHAVGYASVTQFTREYGRLFHAPPGKDIRVATALA